MSDTVFKTIYLNGEIQCSAQVFYTSTYETADRSTGFTGGHEVYASIADVVIEDTWTHALDLLTRDEVARRFGKAELLRAEREIEDALAETLNAGDQIESDEDAEYDPRSFEVSFPIAAE